MTDFNDFWNTDRWGRPYGYKSTDYAGGIHRGHDIAGLEWGTQGVPILRAGTIAYIGRAPGGALGYVFVIFTGTEYDSYCHTVPLGTFKLGRRVSAGSVLFRLARTTAEGPGTSWDGPHCHLVRSKRYDAAWMTDRPVLDPRPIIRACLAADPTPRLATTTQEEDDMPTIYIKAKADATVYALDTVTGTKRGIRGAEWKAIKAAYKAAGRAVPYATDAITRAEVATIPTA